MNQALLRDEGHRCPMTLPELETRMAAFLAGAYQAALFRRGDATVGYALWRTEEEWVYLRQMFVIPEARRQGIASAAFNWLVANAGWERSHVRLEVLVGNHRAIAFWRTLGFTDYAVTMERPLEK